jgi:hypothetical protein
MADTHGGHARHNARICCTHARLLWQSGCDAWVRGNLLSRHEYRCLKITPDRKRYTSMHFRRTPAGSSDIAEISLINPGDILFLCTDRVYDGSDVGGRTTQVGRTDGAQCALSAREICSAVLTYAARKDQRSLDRGESDVIDAKTVFIIKRSSAEG